MDKVIDAVLSLPKLASKEEIDSSSLILPCSVTKVYDIFSIRDLISSSSGKPNVMVIACTDLAISEIPMINNSKGSIPYLELDFLFDNLWFLEGLYYLTV